MPDTWEPIREIEGKTVKGAVKGKTDAGYDIIIIGFTDGTALRIREEGQAGSISYDVWKNQIN